MARRSQYWVVLVAVLFVTVATAALVSADEAAQEEAAPSISEKVGATTDLTKKQAAQAGETVKTWKDWATQQAGEWTGKGKVAAGEASESAKAYAAQGAESFHSSSAKAQETASGVYSKWSKWAKETAEKYRPKKNPAAEAVDYINKKTSSSTDEEL